MIVVLVALVAVPAPASAAARVDCADVVSIALNEGAAGVLTAIEGLDELTTADAAALIAGCLDVSDAEISPEEATAVICDAATALIGQKRYDDAIALIEARLATDGVDEGACKSELAAAKDGADSDTLPESIGVRWADFQDTVVTPLTPIAGFVGAGFLALIVLGRIAAFLPPLRNRRSTAHERTAFGWLGLALAVAVPIATAAAVVALTGMPHFPRHHAGAWSVLGRAGETAVGMVVVNLAFAALAAVALLGYWFATLRQVSISLTEKDDGKGLDSARLLAAIDGIAGSRNGGIEYPVGTDITDAADSVAELSKNPVVAAVQGILKAVLGTRPWVLRVSNEAEDAVSVSISRNGRLVSAHRVSLDKGAPLTEIDDVPAADRIAAVVAGLLIAALRPSYPQELEPGLNGATDGWGIGLQYVASRYLSGSVDDRTSAIPLLLAALERDPQNRGAAMTLANFAYRDPSVHTPDGVATHAHYERATTDAIRRELGSVALSDAAQHPELQSNELLLRLTQVHAAAYRNLLAARRSAPSSAADTDPTDEEATQIRKLQVTLLNRDRVPSESPVTYARRRQALLIELFRPVSTSTGPLPSLSAPDDLRSGEQDAWTSAASATPGAADALTLLQARFACEEKVLELHGDYRNDPIIAYSLACYRATAWWYAGLTPSEES